MTLRAFAGAALAVCLASAVGAQTPQSPQSRDVCPGRWSPPFPLQREGKPVYVEQGVVAALDDRTLALGTPAFFWMTRDSLMTTAALADTAGTRRRFNAVGATIDASGTATPVAPPEPMRFRERPRLVARGGRTLTVAWEASDSTPRARPVEATGIDVATFDGSRWSAPDTPIRAGSVLLADPAVVRTGTDFAPALAAMVGEGGRGTRNRLRIAVLRGNTWLSLEWQDAAVWMIHHASVTSSARGTRSVAVVATMSVHERGSGVYALRGEWVNDTIAWSPAVRLDSLRGSFDGISMAQLGGDSLVAVWHTSAIGEARASIGEPRAEPRNAGEYKVAYTAVSLDAGRSWRLIEPFRLTSAMDGETLVVDASGGLHLVYRGAPEEMAGVMNAPGMIMHSRWRSGAWTRPTAVSSAPSVTDPAAGGASGGRLMAIWTSMVMSSQGPMPKSHASFWTPDCR